MALLHVYPRAHDFLEQVVPVLERKEVLNSLILGISQRFQDFADRVYLASVEDEQGLILAACMTPPFRIILSSEQPENIEAHELIIRDLLAHGWTVPGVVAESTLALAFSESWKRLTGRGYEIGMRERLFGLTEVIPPSPGPGALRQATEKDGPLLAQWAGAFHREALPDDPRGEEGFVQMALKRIRAGDVFLWVLPDGRPVSTALKTRPLKQTITIGMVYTPPEERGHGYASRCVAALSQHLLDSGWSMCCLYTDLANPVSNSIYQKIGYRPIVDACECNFHP
ncbi:hypothetical protein EI42_00063 [Thermosporothrix hazakensis]|jgi:predicted GNAT family acetyltransferase|uniref:N-acetyltransferase domain-containing protein n=2 Tax=Thermosporothrix TaxID=768650 RepID=A0A326UBZ5_THEHA|nr:GNAT family N-acetyltransferase [Thermosporothrix hazakensis]PZW35898.1 hypothetical protein EI42_00063 [Thermosporothrix hazakensis]BBH88365.1 acetyltransferase [Thermosporothrix sp. COM3]GCE46552.1 acetyltransferase [Thermosporothrix hazakensis]